MASESAIAAIAAQLDRVMGALDKQNTELSELRQECTTLRTSNANMERMLHDGLSGRHGSLGENLLTSPTNDNSPFIRPTVLPRINSASQFTPMNAPGPQLTLNTSTKYEIPGFYVVIPAGGAGTRLWPLSRKNHPKFLLDVNLSGRSLLQSTWNRLVPLTGPSRMTVVAGPAHSDAIQIQLPQLEGTNLFTEPGPKDSMAAIGLAAAILAQRDPEAVIGSFAADHMISGEDAFLRAVTEAVHVAKTGKLVTIGIAPSHPATGFGYVKLGEELDVPGANSARLVDAFKEKPDARTAASYIASGNYRWNAGMFVTKATTLMDLVKEHRPDIHAGLSKIAAVWDDESARGAVLEEVWPQLETIAIDNAIAEPAAADGKVAVIPATFGWDDVGDFSSLSEMLPADSNYPRILGESELVVTEQAFGGIIVPGSGRLVACLGVDDLVIVDLPDALMVTTRARSQEVKSLVKKCKMAGFGNLV
ncbi:Putative Mannose-1-phosphate guanylyltransferase (GDP) [[Torrubiella] hemipterigena]|uniref:Mannose-1-phosphate guanyltransferase n=1 Tax=[Torrubiella] hemipterigena TaxID=1531966 RepID=A0A0A1T524_9HYPO|nr:Putative Mannose-1-phosphate guanylyltransferase (GDP) [[Torrubiella] hemipterigena]